MYDVRDYAVIYYWSDDDGRYLAEIPELAGCIQDGKTPEEAIENAYDLAKDWIEIAKEEGWNIPVPKRLSPAPTL